jgi:hypothetical protein
MQIHFQIWGCTPHRLCFFKRGPKPKILLFFNAPCGEEHRRALEAFWFHLCALGLTRPRRRKGWVTVG